MTTFMQDGLMDTASRNEDTGEPRAQKCACVVRRRAGGKGLQPQYLACWLSDFALAFIGPKNEAEAIKQRLRIFLLEELKLNLSEEKTLITHIRDSAAKFLNYEITTYQCDTKQTRNKRGRKGRSINGRIGLKVPRKVVENKCKRYMRNGKPTHRAELLNESDFTIIATYQLS